MRNDYPNHPSTRFDVPEDHPTIPGGGIINALGSAAKKVAFDWPVAGALGILKKTNPWGPIGKGDPHNLYGGASWLHAWNPRMLRGPGFVEQWFHPAAGWVGQHLPENIQEGFQEWKGEGALADKGINYLAKKFGFDPDMRFTDITGKEPRTDIISKFAEGVWAPSEDTKNLYNKLEENFFKLQYQTDEYQGIANNPFYKGIVDTNSELYSILNTTSPALLEEISDMAFLDGEKAVQVFSAFGQNNIGPEKVPMDIFFINNNLVKLNGLNDAMNYHLGENTDAVRSMLGGTPAWLSLNLREMIHGDQLQRREEGANLEDIHNNAKSSILHSSDAGINLAGAFDELALNLNKEDPNYNEKLMNVQNKYLQYSPSYRATTGIFDTSELPFIDRLPEAGGMQNLQDALTLGVHEPWINFPAELHPYEAALKSGHLDWNKEEGLHVSPYGSDLVQQHTEAWKALDDEKRKELMSKYHLPVDLAVLSMLPGRRAIQKKATQTITDPAAVNPLLDLALPKIKEDLKPLEVTLPLEYTE